MGWIQDGCGKEVGLRRSSPGRRERQLGQARLCGSYKGRLRSGFILLRYFTQPLKGIGALPRKRGTLA